MTDQFLERPMLNAPYEHPSRHWELGNAGHWIPGVNNLGSYGRWAFAEFCNVYEMEADFEAKVGGLFNRMIVTAMAEPVPGATDG